LTRARWTPLYAAFGFVQGPLSEQYLTYLRHLIQGDFGISVSSFPVPVTTVIATGLGWTLRLAGTATIIFFVLARCWYRGGLASRTLHDTYVLPTLSLLGAFPYFFVAMLALYIFALDLGWFPLNHASDVDYSRRLDFRSLLLSVIQHAILPAGTIVLTSMGGWMLGMRNNMIGILSQDFIVMAQAKGLRDPRVMLTYAARNAFSPA